MALMSAHSFFKSFTIFLRGRNNGVKIWAYDATRGIFPDKVTTDIGFTDEAVVQWDVPVVKILL